MISSLKSKIKEYRFAFERSSMLRRLGLKEKLASYNEELEQSGILANIYASQKIFSEDTKGAKVRGRKADFGGLGEMESRLLYSIIRDRKPDTIIETGVCNGVSSYIILEALRVNGKGKLVSIDLPEVVGKDDTTYWSGKGGASIPGDRMPGWIVPEDLKPRWDLRLGNSFDLLPGICKEFGSIDLFIHDSEHSYECMSFEYEQAWSHMKPQGLLMSDDIHWNKAFSDFSKKVGSQKGYLSGHLGVLVK